MKKLGVLFLLCLFFISFISAAEVEGLGQAAEDYEGQINDLEQKLDNIEKLSKEDKKWEYLGAELEKIVMRNPVVKGFDDFFSHRFFYWPFKILVGLEYSFSLIFLLAVILWIFFWIRFNDVVAMFGTFSQGTGVGVSFLMVILLAQLNAYEEIARLIFKLIFYKEGWWVWASTIVIILVLVGVAYLSKFARAEARKNREAEESNRVQQNRNIINIIGETLRRGFGKDKYTFTETYGPEHNSPSQAASSNGSNNPRANMGGNAAATARAR